MFLVRQFNSNGCFMRLVNFDSKHFAWFAVDEFPGKFINNKPTTMVSTPCPGRNNIRTPAARSAKPRAFLATMMPI